MNPERTCPDCGAGLPADAPRGLCPNCLMGAALSRAVAVGPGAPAAATVTFEPAGQSTCGAGGRLIRQVVEHQPGIVDPPAQHDAGLLQRSQVTAQQTHLFAVVRRALPARPFHWTSTMSAHNIRVSDLLSSILALSADGTVDFTVTA